MTKLKKYDLSGTVIEEVEWDDAHLVQEVNSQLIKDCIVAYRHNQRQWSASTKTRAEVKCSGKKPRPQKGSGKARQGSFAATQFKGGGIPFGPKPKSDQHVRVNRKEKRAAIRALISEKAKNEKISLLSFKQWKEPKTKLIAQFLQKIGATKRVTFIGNEVDKNFVKSMNNIPKVDFHLVDNLHAYMLALPGQLIVLDKAEKNIKELLKA